MEPKPDPEPDPAPTDEWGMPVPPVASWQASQDPHDDMGYCAGDDPHDRWD